MTADDFSGDNFSADPLLVDTVERLLAAVSTFDEVEHAETDGWSATVWQAIADAGFPWVGIDEAAGGSGVTLYDLAAILRAVGQFAAPAPVAETATGGWLLAQWGIALPPGPVSVVEQPGQIHNGRLQVDGLGAWARHADRIVVVTGVGVCSLRPDQVQLEHGANLAGEARDRVVVDLALDDVEHAIAGGDVRPGLDPWQTARQRGALSRVIMSAGALAAMAQLTVDYTNERRQFGKPVATFQAVQQHLVVAAQSAARAQMAADIAVRAVERGGGQFEIAAARVVTDDAIAVGTRAAHQAHGAMGVTREYALHQLTRRLWSWRHEWGTTKLWRRELGGMVAENGPDRMYQLVTD
jgi:acyl-CoA dehydrogenase